MQIELTIVIMQFNDIVLILAPFKSFL